MQILEAKCKIHIRTLLNAHSTFYVYKNIKCHLQIASYATLNHTVTALHVTATLAPAFLDEFPTKVAPARLW